MWAARALMAVNGVIGVLSFGPAFLGLLAPLDWALTAFAGGALSFAMSIAGASPASSPLRKLLYLLGAASPAIAGTLLTFRMSALFTSGTLGEIGATLTAILMSLVLVWLVLGLLAVVLASTPLLASIGWLDRSSQGLMIANGLLGGVLGLSFLLDRELPIDWSLPLLVAGSASLVMAIRGPGGGKFWKSAYVFAAALVPLACAYLVVRPPIIAETIREGLYREMIVYIGNMAARDFFLMWFVGAFLILLLSGFRLLYERQR